MTNELKVIHEQEVLGQVFKIYGSKEEPFFLAKDVAIMIDYSKSGNGSYNITQMLGSIDEDEAKFFTTKNVSRGTWFVTEDGLYEILMQSRKPIAKQFKKKVKEILKDIRNHGMYMNDNLLEKNFRRPNVYGWVINELQ